MSGQKNDNDEKNVNISFGKDLRSMTIYKI